MAATELFPTFPVVHWTTRYGEVCDTAAAPLLGFRQFSTTVRKKEEWCVAGVVSN
jgi:hypothetical protein